MKRITCLKCKLFVISGIILVLLGLFSILWALNIFSDSYITISTAFLRLVPTVVIITLWMIEFKRHVNNKSCKDYNTLHTDTPGDKKET